ncbi:MAG: TIGR00730 family Rossman fold protein [Planctomycetota bacterium]
MTVFCGSSTGDLPLFVDAAETFALALARRGLGLVYGGGHIGLMGVAADAALAAGAEVWGVIPRAFAAKELAHEGLTHLELVDTMHARKARMAALAGAFVALPGGIGTLEELVEVYTWAQIGIHDRPIGVLDVGDYWDPLFAFLDRAVAHGFVRPAVRSLLVRAADPEALLDALEAAPRGTISGRWPAL